MAAERGGTTILPLIVAPCLFEGSGVDIFQAVNPPEKPLVEMSTSERERTLVKLAETISKRLAVEGILAIPQMKVISTKQSV